MKQVLEALSAGPAKPNLLVQVDGSGGLDVRSFQVKESLSSLFTVDLEVVSNNAALDPEGVIGKAASFRIEAGVLGEGRIFRGIVNQFLQSRKCELKY